MNDFARAYATTDDYEGGFVSAAQAAAIGDPGGATDHGISLRAVASLDLDHDGVLDFDLDHDGDVDEADIRLLEVHPEKRAQFYRDQYWAPVRAGEMPWPWSLLAFDAAVLHGVEAAAFLCQRAVGAPPDGAIGSVTLARVAAAPSSAIERYIAERGLLMAKIHAARYAHVPREKSPTFGWLLRLARIHRVALEASVESPERR